MNRLPLVVAGLVGLVAGAVAGGVTGVFEDTKTETAPPETVVQNKTKTKTVRRGSKAAAPRVVTRTQTVTVPGTSSADPGDAGATAPVRTVTGTKSFTGKDFKQFGTLKVNRTSTMKWTNSGNVFSVISQTALHVSSTKKKGSVVLYKGSYPQFRVAAIGRWKFTLTPR